MLPLFPFKEFPKSLKSPKSVGEGELNSEKIGFVPPHLNPPPSKGEGIIEEILDRFG